eukprot:gnl/TRDRNA2_/TRDRNA2_195799_c0_seq1.p1 gnl/TRDRNA2_/TRDRNA2_195799_c0~~gnl/TRDRNA2_/TRDRNA2_195799_c0_seq1.p1  ORF type:complete len:199 (+),score=43.41 gnl/TRDRNA2_/TRDRNA2_195799_c0_seq1:63-599(+)
MTASLDELKEALVETLENRGVLGQVKAKVRAEIFAALDDEQVKRPELPKENVVINELIREYLEYNGYHHTLSVLLPESGHPEVRQFNREFLAGELRMREDARSQSLPLIYALVRDLRSNADTQAAVPAAPPPPDSTEANRPRAAVESAQAGNESGEHVELEPLVIHGAGPSTKQRPFC